MTIMRTADVKSKRGPAEYFTGTVWLDEIAAVASASRVRAVRVAFEPGARTAWHTHPHGQSLHILSGVGRVQKAGEAVMEVFPGDSVWFEPGERHWHGAAPHSLMVHLAVQLADDRGVAVTWLEHVSDTDYGAR
ncbi:MAG: cupin domain-containing protein [Opitutus sp.]|nr:cupin domain-containing protein [Opitutus sp.]